MFGLGWIGSLFESNSQEELLSARKSCAPFTKALKTCLEANKSVASNGLLDRGMLPPVGSATPTDGEEKGVEGRQSASASGSSSGRDRNGSGSRPSQSSTIAIDPNKHKKSCAGLAGSTAHCLGIRLSSCSKLARDYQRCFVKHGLQPSGGSGSCRQQEKRLIRCVVRSGVGKDSGLKEYG